MHLVKEIPKTYSNHKEKIWLNLVQPFNCSFLSQFDLVTK